MITLKSKNNFYLVNIFQKQKESGEIIYKNFLCYVPEGADVFSNENVIDMRTYKTEKMAISAARLKLKKLGAEQVFYNLIRKETSYN